LQAATTLQPLVTWVQQLKLVHLEPLVQACTQLLADGLRSTMADVPAFATVPELRRLQLLWLDYIVPLVMDKEAKSPARNAMMLQEVQTELLSYLVDQAKQLLEEVQQKMLRQVRAPVACAIA
jgi:hypothetical protein